MHFCDCHTSLTLLTRKTKFFSNLTNNNQIKNNSWKKLFKKKRLKIRFISLIFVLLPISCAKKISQNTQVQNEKYKKKNEQISVMRNQYNKQVKYGRKKEKIERDESVALWVPGK